MVEIEHRVGRGAFVAETGFGGRVIYPDPFVRFAWIIQAQIVIDRLGCEHDRQPLGERLKAVKRTVAADANETLNAELFEPGHDQIETLPLFGTQKIPGRTNEVLPLVVLSPGISCTTD